MTQEIWCITVVTKKGEASGSNILLSCYDNKKHTNLEDNLLTQSLGVIAAQAGHRSLWGHQPTIPHWDPANI